MLSAGLGLHTIIVVLQVANNARIKYYIDTYIHTYIRPHQWVWQIGTRP